MRVLTMASKPGFVTLWNDRALSDYTKEELIEIVETLGGMLTTERKHTMQILDVLAPVTYTNRTP